MAQQTRVTLKSWFETGDYPTAAQFAHLIDTFMSLLEDTITIAQVAGLQDALDNIQAPAQTTTRELKLQKFTNVSTSQTFLMPAKSMLWFAVGHHKSGSASISIGTTPGGTEIMSARSVTAIKDSVNQIPTSFPAETTIYITNAGGGTIDLNLDYETNYFA